jgi:hypothetical protein
MPNTFNIFPNSTTAPTGAGASMLVAAIAMTGGQTHPTSAATAAAYRTGPAADRDIDALAWRGAG